MADDIKSLNLKAEELVKAGVSRNGLARQLRISYRAASDLLRELGIPAKEQLPSVGDETWWRQGSIKANAGLLQGFKDEAEAGSPYAQMVLEKRTTPVETEAVA